MEMMSYLHSIMPRQERQRRMQMNGIEIYGIKLDDQGNLIDMVGARESILNIKEEMIY